MKQIVVENKWRAVQVRVSGVLKANPWSINARQASVKNETQLQGAALNTWEDEGGKMPPSAPAKKRL